MDCATCHPPDAVHSTLSPTGVPLFPTAQHSVVDGHDMLDNQDVPDIDCTTPHPLDAVHSTTDPIWPLLPS